MSDFPRKCWVFDSNRRVYAPGLTGPPIYREHFREDMIVGETRTSWFVGAYRVMVKYAKDTLFERVGRDRGGSGRRLFLTEQDVEDDVWAHENRYAIVERVRRAKPDVLRKVDALLAEIGQ